MKRIIFLLILFSIVFSAMADEQIYRTDHSKVTCSGIDAEYAKALAATAGAANLAAKSKFGFDMPETIIIEAKMDPRGRVRLFNDGQDRMYLTVTDTQDLGKPQTSGVHHIYGICHEVGHLAMYRIIKDHNWMTTAATEGWAHYLGSQITDEVYAAKGEELWPDRHNYLEDGTARLKKQMSMEEKSGITAGAELWMELAEILGDKGIAEVFKAWSKAEIKPSDPGAALRKSLIGVKPEDSRLSDWWNRAEPILVYKRPQSGFALRTAKSSDLARAPVGLGHDDGVQAGKKSIAGSGHMVKFDVPGHSWYLTHIRIYGQRYGYPKPPNEDFHVWLCDSEFKAIADFPFPYSKFSRDNAKWVNLQIEPTNVPPGFIICAGFNPTGTKGVYVGHDEQGSGNSFTGLPGTEGNSFSSGDWLIRVRLDQLESADALKETKPDRNL